MILRWFWSANTINFPDGTLGRNRAMHLVRWDFHLIEDKHSVCVEFSSLSMNPRSNASLRNRRNPMNFWKKNSVKTISHTLKVDAIDQFIRKPLNVPHWFKAQEHDLQMNSVTSNLTFSHWNCTRWNFPTALRLRQVAQSIWVWVSAPLGNDFRFGWRESWPSILFTRWFQTRLLSTCS